MLGLGNIKLNEQTFLFNSLLFSSHKCKINDKPHNNSDQLV
jgi:hypothetical protein